MSSSFLSSFLNNPQLNELTINENLIEKSMVTLEKFLNEIIQTFKPSLVLLFGKDNKFILECLNGLKNRIEFIDTEDPLFIHGKRNVLIINTFKSFNELEKLITPECGIVSIQTTNDISEFIKTSGYNGFFSTKRQVLFDSVITLNYFVKKDYKLRFGNEVDFEKLVSIETLCWEPDLRASRHEIAQRIKNHPQGQFVITKNDQVLGVIYTQRIDIIQSIKFVDYNNISSIFKKNGKYAQLLSLNVPSRGGDIDTGLAHYLIELALQVYSNLKGIEKIFAVTLCKNFTQGNLDRYIHLKNDDGLPVDPILRMHCYHGAEVKELVPNYRPLDKKNQGNGVLVEYDLNRKDFTVVSDQVTSYNELTVLDSIKKFYTNDELSTTTPFNVMGLDSLEYTDISIDLSKKFGVNLDASVFYSCKTPLDLYNHLTQNESSGVHETVTVTRDQDMVAIIGMECRFPNDANNLNNYWSCLIEGKDCTTSRWENDPMIYSKRGGFINNSDLFDAEFFKISKNEANLMDPQQRILMEVTWNALENSCIDPVELKSTYTSVFVGVSSNDYEELIRTSDKIDKHAETGNSRSLLSGRLSYFYELNGPSVSIDTACSSSLVALNYGCESILNGNNNLSIVAGVNLIHTPRRTRNDCVSKLLSKSGHCKVFDETADGYVRSEGCGVLILKRYSHAVRDGNNILAVVKGIGVNQNSGRNNLTAPNMDQQAGLIRDVLQKSGLSVNDVDYIEVNGSANFLGDIIEVNSIKKAFMGRDKVNKLILGSVKPNIGHLEACSGIAGLIKIIMSINKQEIPRQIYLDKVNPQMEHELIPSEILKENRVWKSGSGIRRAGISSFGMSGTNAHCILEEFKQKPENTRDRLKHQWNDLKEGLEPLLIKMECNDFDVEERSHHLLTFSCKTNQALEDLKQKYLDYLTQTSENPGDVGFSAGVGRSHFEYRVAIVGKDVSEWSNCLKSNNVFIKLSDPSFNIKKTKTAFIMTNGVKNIYPRMSQDLYNSNILFKTCMNKCSEIINKEVKVSLLDILLSDKSVSYLNENCYIQPALFSVQYSLGCLLESFGIIPDIYYGDCEFVSAVLNQTISLEDGIRLSILYGKYLDGHFDLKPSLFDFVQYTHKSNKWFSTSLGFDYTDRLASSYWIQSFRNSYNQEKRDENLKKLYSMETRVFVDFNPNSILNDLTKQVLVQDYSNILVLKTLKKNFPDWLLILSSLSQWYVNGGDVKWKHFDSSYIRKKVVLPTYPFQRKSFWFDKESDLEVKKPTVITSTTPSDLESTLNQIFKIILGVEDVSNDSNFFSIGGNSLKLSELKTDIQRQFKVDIPFIQLFKNPTVNGLASIIKQTEPISDSVSTFTCDTVNRYEPFSLTDVQASYFFGRQGFTPLGNVSTHLYYEIDLENLDFDAFEDALNKMINRHDTLRSVINNNGFQVVLKECPFYDIKLNDFSGLGSKDQESGLIEVRKTLSHQVLDSSKWPLYEVQVSKTSNSFRLHLSFDCLILDMYSVYLIMNEWYQLYNGAQVQPPLEITFRDYVTCLDQIKEQDKLYWKKKIKNMSIGPQIPLRQDPRTIKSQTFDRKVKVISKHQWQNVKSISSEFGISVTSVLLGAFAAVIGRWSSNKKFSLNLTLFRRQQIHRDINLVLGDFTCLEILSIEYKNFLVKKFHQCVQELHDELWSDLEHVSYSGVNVQRDLIKHKGLNSLDNVVPVVFTSLLNLSSIGTLDKHLQNFGRLSYSITQTPQVWLDNKVFEENDCLVLEWDYVSELFDDQVIQTMHDSYCWLIENMTTSFFENPLPEILTGPIIKETVYKPVKDFKDSDKYLDGLFTKTVSEYPNKEAVKTQDKSVTYLELYTSSIRLSQVLIKLGAKRNELVAVLMDKCIESVTGFYSILFSGAAFMYIDPETPEARLQELLSISETKIILSMTQYRATLTSVGQKVVYLDELDFETDEKIVTVDRDLDDLAYVIFTSGTTGKPKGVMITHRAVVNTILDMNTEFNVTSLDSVLCISNLSFDLSVYDIFGLLGAGGTVILMSKAFNRTPEVWVDLVKSHKITIWNSVPMLMEMLCEYTTEHFDSFRLVLLSGDWIPLTLPEKIRKVFTNSKLELRSLGGATEASIWSVWHRIDKIDNRLKTIPYGRAMNNQFLYILNDDFEHCAPKVTGHIYIGGVGLAKGYWKDSKITDEKFVTHNEERLYKTGDLGFWSLNGEIILLGREDFQVKLNGLRIELNEIEFHLNKLNYVHESVAVLNEENKSLVAFIKNPKLCSDHEINEKTKALDFKLKRFNLRQLEPIEKIFLNKSYKPSVNEYYSRKSYRSYSSQKVDKKTIEDFLVKSLSNKVGQRPFEIKRTLGVLSAHKENESLLPKYLYPSAGSLYPVQTFISIKTDEYNGLYYFNPEEYSLNLLGPSTSKDTVFHFVGCSKAIKPLYGDNWKKYAIIEAGCMIELIGAGLVQVDVKLDFEIDQDDFLIGSFALGETSHIPNELTIYAFIENELYRLEDSKLVNCNQKQDHPVYMNFTGDYSSILKSAGFFLSVFGDETEGSLLKAGSLLQFLTQKGVDENLGFCALGIPPVSIAPNGLVELISLSGGHVTTDQIRQRQISEPPENKETITETLGKYLSYHIPNYMIPSSFYFIEKIPISSNGKVDRKELSKMIGNKIQVKQTQENIDDFVSKISGVLQVENLNLDSSFLSNGGNSLYAIRLSNIFKKEGVDIKPTEFFLHSSLRSLITKFNKKIEPTTPQKVIESNQGNLSEPIAIIGMSGRFPGAESIEEFWKNLCNGVEGTTFFTDEELLALGVDGSLLKDPSYVKAKAMLPNISDFDADFFDYTPKEAKYANPSVRLFLESVWTALENAGCCLEDKKSIGIFAGSGGNNYLDGDYYKDEGFLKIINNQDDYLATRVAFKLNFKGPAITVKTACSTGLVAVHLACQSLRLGESDITVAGAVHSSYHETTGYNYIEGSIFSKYGRCRTFDAKADGIIESQGVGSVVLKRLSDAIVDRDHIWAVIKGAAVNNDGSEKAGYTVPSADSQVSVINQALKNSGITPDRVGFIEAHGTGTPLGDPIEVMALTSVFEKSQKNKQSVAIGSVKTNIGHCVTAAGIAGLIKTALMVYNKSIPPSLHFEKPNPQIMFETTPFYVNTTLKKWDSGKSMVGGVSSFGIGGTNAHCILEEFKQKPENTRDRLKHQWNDLKEGLEPLLIKMECNDFDVEERSHHLLTFSCKTNQALEDLKQKYLDYLTQTSENPGDVGFSAGVGRSHFEHRVAIVGKDVSEWSNCLKSNNVFIKLSDPSFNIKKTKTAFIMTNGVKNIYPRMSQDLYNSNILFKTCMNKCSVIINKEVKVSLLDILFSDKSVSYLNENCYIQPALFSVQYSLGCLLESFGIIPDIYYGDCEFVSAVLNQTISLEDGIRLSILYGKYLDGHFDLKPSLFDFVQYTHKSNKWFSTSLGFDYTDRLASSYWIQSFRNSYNQEKRDENLKKLYSMGTRVFVDFNPNSILNDLTKQVLVQDYSNILVLKTLKKNFPDWLLILSSLSQWYVKGGDVKWKHFDSSYIRKKVVLPTYPFQRKSYWHKENAFKQVTHENSLIGDPVVIDNKIFLTNKFNLNIRHFDYVNDHKFFDNLIFPGSSYLDYFIRISQLVLNKTSFIIKNIKFLKPLIFSRSSLQFEQTVTPKTDGSFDLKFITRSEGSILESISNSKTHSTAELSLVKKESSQSIKIDELKSRCTLTVSKSEFYDLYHKNGLAYGNRFLSVNDFRMNDQEIYAEIESLDISDHPLSSILLDASFQVLSYYLIKNSNQDFSYLPFEIESVQKYCEFDPKMVVHVKLDTLGSMKGSIKIYKLNGELAYDIKNFVLKDIPKDIVHKVFNKKIIEYVYEETLVLKDESRFESKIQKSVKELWVLFCSENEISKKLINEFKVNKIESFTVHPGVGNKSDYLRLFNTIKRPFNILHMSDTKSLLYIIQSMIELNLRPNCFGVITTGNYLIQSDTDLSQSTLNGLCRTIESEHPEFNLRQIDTDENFTLKTLISELVQPHEDLYVIHRDNKRYVPFLERVEIKQNNVKFDPNDKFLVTGALGGLGFLLTQWFIKKGVKSLVLISRRSPSKDQTEKINSWKNQGVNIEIHSIDIGDMENLLLSQKGITGVFHLAGILEDKTLKNMTWNDFERVYHSKVNGSFLLHKLTKNLKYFVLFSSLTAWIGSSGQANYTSANSFMDNLALKRRAMGLPGQSIAWGAWSQTGMAANFVTSIQKDGIESFTPEEGFDLFESMLNQDKPKVLVAKVKWDLIVKKGTRYQGYLQKLVSPVIETKKEDFYMILKKTGKNDRYNLLKERLVGIIKNRLGTSEDIDENIGFVDMGLDSLIMIGVRQDIQLEIGDQFNLPQTLLIESASLRLLCNDLLSIMFEKESDWRDNTTPFIYACGNGYYESVVSFLEEDYDVNERDINGRTGLLVATLENKKDIVELLVTFDANVNLSDRNGDTPVDVAVKFGYNDLLEILGQQTLLY